MKQHKVVYLIRKNADKQVPWCSYLCISLTNVEITVIIILTFVEVGGGFMLLNVLSISLSMSIIIVLLALFRNRINNRYHAKVMCMLWLVVAIRMVIPNYFEFPIYQPILKLDTSQKIIEITEGNIEIITQHNQKIYDSTTVLNPSVIETQDQTMLSISLENVIGIIWVIGSCIVLSVNLMRYFSVLRWLKKHCVKINEIGNISIYSSSVLPESFVFGVFKPSIYLSEEFLRNEWVLIHELTHCKHRDGIMQALMCFVKCIHWFNPFVYLMEKYWDADREMYCDETVLKDRTKNERIDYLITLYKAAESMMEKKLKFTSGLIDGEISMKERFLRIKKNTLNKTGKALTILLSFIIIVSSGIIGCSKKADVIQEDYLLEEMLARIENDNMQIEALILEGPDWQQQNDGELIECYIKYTHGIEVKHPEYLFDSYDYMDRVLENKGILQAFYELNAQEIHESLISEKDAIVRVSLEGMSIWFYEEGIMKLTSCSKSGLQEIKYYNIETESIKHLQNILLEDFYQYWVKGKGAKEREEDPSINEIWQIKQVIENDLETLKEKI